MDIPSAFQIGPLMLATDRVLAIVLILAFLAVTGLIAKKADRRADRAGWWALAIGVVAARVGFVASNWDAFAAEPASILAVWQGGFSIAAGLAGAIAAILLTLPRVRPAFALAAAAALLSGTYLLGT